jgi:hypothetical protein
MLSIDSSSFDGWAAIHIAAIAYLVGAITLLGYVRAKRFTSLLMSISFFLLVIPPLCSALANSWKVTLLDWVFIDLVYIVAFVLLVIAYFFETRKQRINLQTPQRCVVAVSFVLPLLYSVYQYVIAPFDLYAYFGLGPLIHYVLLYLSIGLMAVVVTLMFSFHSAKGNRNLLIGMVGFLMILSGWAFTAVLQGLGALETFEGLTNGWANLILSIAGFIGYLIFLVAIHRTRLVRG